MKGCSSMWNKVQGMVLRGSLVCLLVLSVNAGAASAFEEAAPLNADVITGATPHAKGTPWINKSTCWKNPDCNSCHGDAHLAGFEPAACPTCHGPIGASKRPPTLPNGNDHPDQACTQCHGGAHADLSFESPEDCRACHEYARPRRPWRCSRRESYDAVVIGSGGGGLAAAARLAMQGLDVVLLEQHFRLGGSMNNFKRYDYRFETSLHAFAASGYASFGALGIADQIIPIADDVMYRTVYPDFTLDIPADVDAYRALLKTQFPAQASNIDALFDGFNSLDFATYHGMSLLEALAYHGIDDERLIAVFTLTATFLVQGGIDTVPATDFLPMWYVFHNLGYLYVLGGSQAIVDALENAIENAGGTIKRNARVRKIFVEDNQVEGVQTADGVCYDAPYVVSNADAKQTFLKLVGRRHLPREMVAEVKGRRPAESPVATLFLGVDADYTDAFPENSHTIYVMDNYAMQTEEWEKLACLPEQIILIVQNYTAADPTTAPPGKNALVVTAFLMNYACNDYWNWYESYDAYQCYKTELAQVLVGRLEALLPGVSEHIEVAEMMSPHTVKSFTLNPGGSWAGWAFEPGEAFEYTDRIDTPIDGLYMAGAWAAGAGQSVVLQSGIEAADMIIADIQ